MKARVASRIQNLALLTVIFLFSSLFGQDATNVCLLAGSTPEANANTLRAIAFGLDRFVAVGDGGMVVLSTNAVNWLRQPAPTTSSLYGVIYGADRFVAVGDAGIVLWSTNGLAWNAVSAGPTNNFRRVAFGNGKFVALTDNLGLLCSSDSTLWQPSTNGVPNGRSFFGLYFGGGSFVACGNDGAIITSSDGLNWTNTSVSTWSTFFCGAYGNGVFVTAGRGEFGADQVASSTNGVFWTTQRLNNFYALCYGGGFFVGVFDGGPVQYSSDGKTWTNGSGAPGLGVAYGFGYYAAVGSSGAIFTATNPSTWTQRNPAVCPIQVLAEGNGVSVGITINCAMIYSSEDGIHYLQRRACGGFLTSLEFANGIFVAAGNIGVLISADGTNWASFSPPCGSTVLGLSPIWGLGYEQGVWVAVCQNIISSVDATNWTIRAENAGYLRGLIYGNHRWVAFGWDGLIWSSPDGTNWLNCSYNSPADWGPGVFQDGLFSLYGPVGYLLPASAVVSRDGVQWFDPAKSGPLLALDRGPTEDLLTLSLAGEWGRTYGFQISTNLSFWSDAGTVTNSNGVTSQTFTNTGTGNALFFRALAK